MLYFYMENAPKSCKNRVVFCIFFTLCKQGQSLFLHLDPFICENKMKDPGMHIPNCSLKVTKKEGEQS